jgi:PAS domain S-box-containing protein
MSASPRVPAPAAQAADVPEARVRDAARLAALRASGLRESTSAAELDRIARLAARAVRAPAAFASLVDETCDRYLAAFGLPEPLASTRVLAGPTLCHHTVAIATSAQPLVIADTSADARWRDVPSVRTLGVAAYMGVPLLWNGEAIGALCAIDVVPRAWSDDDVAALRDAAATMQHELELRALARTAGDAQRRVESVLSSISDAFFTLDPAWRFTFVNDRAEHVLQRARGDLLQRSIWEAFPAALGSTFEREYRRAMATGEPVAFEAYYPPPLDSWYEVRAYPGPDGMAVYFQDITERRRAAAALAESEARFRAVQEASPDGSIVMRALRGADGAIQDFAFLYANAAASRILLDGDEPIVGRTMCEAFPDSVEAGRLAIYARVVETGEPWLHDIYFTRGGVARGLRVSAVKVDDGVHLGFADLTVRIRDAAERERLLAALQEERALRSAVDAQMPAGLIVVEAPSGRLRYWNPETERLLGHPMRPAEAVAEYGPYGGVHADGRRYAPEEYPIARAVRGEVLDQYPLTYDRPSGERVQLSVNASPVRDANGTITHAVCTLTDVTARERAAERTRQLQEVSAALAAARTPADVTDRFVAHAVSALGAFGGSLALVDDDGAHASFAHAIGYSEEEVVRWQTFPLALATPFGDAIRGGEVIVVSGMAEWEARYPHLVPSARLLTNETLISLPLCVGEHTIGVVGLGFRDVRALAAEDRTYLVTLAGIAAQALDRARAYERERRAHAEADEARRRAEAARREAEQANAVKAQFLATMSHELRTPLNAIGGYTQLLEMGVHGPVTAAQLEALGRVQRSQQHLLGLINSVLNYAKLEAGRVTYELTTAPVLEIVRAVESLVAPQARAKGLTLAVEACDPPLAVLADVEKARQVVLNLLSNAVKFTPAGGRVTVACAGGAGSVAIEVRDTGRGIHAEQLPRVFDPFVQVGRRLTSEDEGTGLGLAISRDLARGMGGDLTAESVEGEGSIFRFTLPADELPAPLGDG